MHERPFSEHRRVAAAGGRQVCLPELEEKSDLSLLHGMTRGLRETLGSGRRSSMPQAAANDVGRDGWRATRVSRPALLQPASRGRRRRAPRSRPLPESRPTVACGWCREGGGPLSSATSFAERVYYFGILAHARDRDGEVLEAFPASGALTNCSAFTKLIEQAAQGRACRCGTTVGALPRWFDRAAWRREQSSCDSRLASSTWREGCAARRCIRARCSALHSHVQLRLWASSRTARAKLATRLVCGPSGRSSEARLRAQGAVGLGGSRRADHARWVEGDGLGSDVLKSDCSGSWPAKKKDEARSSRDLRALPVERTRARRRVHSECGVRGRRLRDSLAFSVDREPQQVPGGGRPVGWRMVPRLRSRRASWSIAGHYDEREQAVGARARSLLARAPESRSWSRASAYCVDRRPLGLRGRLQDVVRAGFATSRRSAAVLSGDRAAGRVTTERHRRATEKLLAQDRGHERQSGARPAPTRSPQVGLCLIQGPPGCGQDSFARRDRHHAM